MPNEQIRSDLPPTAGRTSPAEDISARGSAGESNAPTVGPFVLQVRWWLFYLFFIALCAGVGYVVYLVLHSVEGSYVFVSGIAAAIVIVCGLIYWLERDYRLSRLFGLQTEPNRSPIIDMVFHPNRRPETARAGSDGKHSGHEVSVAREVAETVVFVVVLVLLLKAFVAQAFVIPTGSMAVTLYGYQMDVVCPKCGIEFPVNASYEVDPSDGGPTIPVERCICPNCRWTIDFHDEMRHNPKFQRPSPSTGDRVLVADYLYDLQPPKRLDVVVFKYPGDSSRPPEQGGFPVSGPQKQQTAMNYIKRLTGRPGETIGIWYGKLYYLPADQLPQQKIDEYRARTINNIWTKRISNGPPEQREALQVRAERGELPPNWEKDVWRIENMFEDDLVTQLRSGGGFRIIRKPPAKILEMRRIVYDNDHPPEDLHGDARDRWFVPPKEGWSDLEPHGFQAEPAGGETSWLRYRHILRTNPKDKQLITDFMGYNTYEPRRVGGMPRPNWVGDLLVECEVAVQQPTGTFTLELSKGVDRFRAAWDLASGKCTLFHLLEKHEGQSAPADSRYVELDSKTTKLKGKGKYRVRFANIDDRLLVWVDDDLPFGDGVNYESFPEKGPYHNDLQPASIGVQGATLQVRRLSLWRDTYYTRDPNMGADASLADADWANPLAWDTLRYVPGVGEGEIKPRTFYVQPGHYLCMGDNSPESSDGRSWGLVPERLLLGRALMVYWPFNRAGRIR
jgi:signal peptidase I